MDRLSDEILGEIFLWCIPIGNGSRTTIDQCPQDAPLVLLLVCRRWKSEAKSNPRLWTSIALHVPRRPGPLRTPPTSSPEYAPYIAAWAEWWHRVRDVARGLRVWIKRSCTLPLDVYVDNTGREPVPITPEQDTNNNTILVCLYGPLLKEEYRWRSLHASVDYESLLWGFLFRREPEDTPGGLYPLIEDVKLDIGMKSEFNDQELEYPRVDSGLSTVICRSPTVRSVHTGSTPLRILDLPFILPFWGNITNIGFIEAAPEEVVQIFKTCPLLQKCKLVCPDIDLEDEVDVVVIHSKTIVMSYLSEAYFQDYTSFRMNQISVRVEAPYLKHLGLANTMCDHAPWRRCNTELYEIVLECAETLESLGLDHVCMTKVHLLTYFEKLKGLKKLRLDYSRVGEDGGDDDDWYEGGMFDGEILQAMTSTTTMQEEEGSGYAGSDCKDEHQTSDVSETANTFLPNLREFVCITTGSKQGSTFDEEDILRFIQSRRPPSTSANCPSWLLCAVFYCKAFGTEEWQEKMCEEVDLAEILKAGGVNVEGLEAKGMFLRVAPQSHDTARGEPLSNMGDYFLGYEDDENSYADEVEEQDEFGVVVCGNEDKDEGHREFYYY
ncbi:hypothetical protein EST38_g7515 [Candolleomyces aberdarensis]|uniref:F-box domain-containing protein n=1 Tax=Candolleomyces aberdarensis TaxID=2316362 RepID=A0A4Q2DH58_9AGAR|nr:hypothetical protein EST38_g7515 [Candolleomyces aberdarensis]